MLDIGKRRRTRIDGEVPRGDFPRERREFFADLARTHGALTTADDLETSCAERG